MNKDIGPVYHGKRTFLGSKDLVVSLYTKKCQFECSFCDIPNNSSEWDVPIEDILKQIHWVFDQYEDELNSFRQLSIGNEGSILDRSRFPEDAMDFLLERIGLMKNLDVLSLETRYEFVIESYLDTILSKNPAKNLDLTIGFETQDDHLRNTVLKKNMKRPLFERKVQLLGEKGIRLTSYVMLKPGPTMSDEEGVEEAEKTVEYLHQLCSFTNTDLVVYLNPTYVAKESPLSYEMAQNDYKPPTIQSVLEVIMKSHKLGIPTYTGLWSENLADESGDYKNREGYNPKFRSAIKEFNKTQDVQVLKKLRY